MVIGNPGVLTGPNALKNLSGATLNPKGFLQHSATSPWTSVFRLVTEEVSKLGFVGGIPVEGGIPVVGGTPFVPLVPPCVWNPGVGMWYVGMLVTSA